MDDGWAERETQAGRDVLVLRKGGCVSEDSSEGKPHDCLSGSGLSVWSK